MWVQNSPNLSPPPRSVPKTGYLVAGKSDAPNKPSWGFCFLGFPCFSLRTCSATGWAGAGKGWQALFELKLWGSVSGAFSTFWNWSPLLHCIFLAFGVSEPFLWAVLQVGNSFYRRSCDAISQCCLALSNPQPWERYRGLFPFCPPGRRATCRGSSPWASPGFPGSARSRVLAGIRGWVMRWGAQHPGGKSRFKQVVFP